MFHTCFVCTGETQAQCSQNSKDISVLLCQILEIPKLQNNVTGFNEISYCPGCLGRILSIRDMLEDLDRLEKKILDEKYLIENQLKENSKKQNDEREGQMNCSTDELRIIVGAELRANTIRSKLKKIREKRVDRKRPVRIMKNVIIPITPTVKNGRNCQKSGDPALMQRRALGRGTDILMYHESRINYQESLPLGNHLEMQSNSGNDNFEVNTCQTTWTASDVEDVGIDIKYDVNSYLSEERYDPLGVDVVPMSVSEYVWQNTTHTINPVTTGTSTETECTSNSAKSEVEVGEQFKVTEFKNVQEVAEGSGNSKTFIRGTCGAGFESCNQLLIHDRVHLKPRRRSKNINATYRPNKRASSKLETRRQSQNLKVPSSWGVKCYECGRILSTQKTLTDHIMQVHRRQHKLKCTLCDFGCQLKANLRDHLATHSDVRDFKCHLCPSTFKLAKSLQRHFKVHKDKTKT